MQKEKKAKIRVVVFSSFLLVHDMAKFYGRALFLGIFKDIFHSNCTKRIDLEGRKTSFLQDGNFCLVHDEARVPFKEGTFANLPLYQT